MLIPKDKNTRLIAIVAAGIVVATYAIVQSAGIANAVAPTQAPGLNNETNPELAPPPNLAPAPNAEMPEEVDDDESANLDLPIDGGNDGNVARNQVEDEPGSMNFDQNGNLVRSAPQSNQGTSHTSGDEVPQAE